MRVTFQRIHLHFTYNKQVVAVEVTKADVKLTMVVP